MTPRTPYGFAAAAVVTGVVGLALTSPAAATVDPAPPPAAEDVFRHTQHGGSLMQTPTPPTSVTDEDSPWAEIGVAALGGVALAGVGIAASVVVRRRSVAHTAYPQPSDSARSRASTHQVNEASTGRASPNAPPLSSAAKPTSPARSDRVASTSASSERP